MIPPHWHTAHGGRYKIEDRTNGNTHWYSWTAQASNGTGVGSEGSFAEATRRAVAALAKFEKERGR